MKLLIVLSLVVFIQIAHSQYGTVDEEWEKFKVKYNKSYESHSDEAAHKQRFANRLAEIIEHNRLYDEGKETYRKGLNQFSDLDTSEIPKGLNTKFAYPTGFIKGGKRN